MVSKSNIQVVRENTKNHNRKTEEQEDNCSFFFIQKVIVEYPCIRK